MEIAPIPGIRALPRIAPKQADLGLMDVFQIENTSRTGDETYSPSGAKADSGVEEDDEFILQEDELEDEFESGPVVKKLADHPDHAVSYFA
jgi:hypothetical protein